MIANDQELKVTLDRIAQFQAQVAHVRNTETNPINYRAAVSGFLAEISRYHKYTLGSELREKSREIVPTRS